MVYILELKVINAAQSTMRTLAQASAKMALEQIVEKKYGDSVFVQRCVEKGIRVRHAAIVANKEKSRRRFEYISVMSSQGEEILQSFL